MIAAGPHSCLLSKGKGAIPKKMEWYVPWITPLPSGKRLGEGLPAVDMLPL
jgi:hypothetical protein